jgi:molecular chaperone GrpE
MDKPVGKHEEDETYVIDDTGDLQEVGQKLIDEALAGPPPGAAGASSAETEAIRAENQKLRDQLLRSRADFENFRKRAEREKTDYFKYALADTIRDLLPVVDNLERAVSHAGDGSEEVQKGIDLIHKQMMDLLQRYGVKPVGAISEPFDPAKHEAIMREENTSLPANSVAEVFQRGYALNDRLLRPAMVKVAVGGKREEEAKPS